MRFTSPGRMKNLLAAIILTCACASPTATQRTPLGCPSAHADAFEACFALLESSFPDTPRDGWEILECGDLGVLATDLTGRDETFAVTANGDIWHVDETCGWSLLASGPSS